MTKTKSINRFLPLVCLLIVSALFGTIGAYTGARAQAMPSVLTDLQKDPTFTADDYPVDESDARLQVIQIAESTARELLVYVYVPSGKLEATSINISTAINDSLHYVNYPLRLVDSAETLHKYRVGNLTVKADALRYYDISSIYRKWDEHFDAKPTDDNTVAEVAYPVEALFTACTVGDRVSYGRTVTETIVVTDKHVGFIRYPNGFKLTEQSCDAHYIAFSTDRNMDYLLEADVYFVTRRCTYTYDAYHGDETICHDPIEQSLTLLYTDVATNPADGLFAHKYTWKRIETVADFVANEDQKLTDDTKAALQSKTWVLRFYESPYSEHTGIGSVVSSEYTKVTDVTILRLKFETNKVVYNLGVVDNKQQGDDNPDNESEKSFPEKVWEALEHAWGWLEKAWNWCKTNWKWIVGVLIGVVVLAFVIKFIRWVLD